MKGLTPYQGRNRAFGLFDCYECTNEWSSTYSWANTPQACLYCNMFVYPYKQWKLKRTTRIKKNSTPNKEHIQKLCGRCRFSSLSCSEME